MKKKAQFIVLEGGEGSGKSSQMKVLAKHFGERVLLTREPGGSAYAEEIRALILHSKHAKQADAKTHFALFWAARADHMKNTILPALAEGKHVLCDRFDSSTYAYQVFAQEAKELKRFFWDMRAFYLPRVPDQYIFLDVEPRVGLVRKQKQKDETLNHFDERDIAFHTRMRAGLLDFFTHVPHSVVDANPPFNAVTASLISTMEKYL
jgi:dTMP kinase